MPQDAWSGKRERRYEHILSVKDVSSGHRGGKGSHAGEGGRTFAQLYNEAKSLGLKGRSTMNKQELLAALGRK